MSEIHKCHNKGDFKQLFKKTEANATDLKALDKNATAVMAMLATVSEKIDALGTDLKEIRGTIEKVNKLDWDLKRHKEDTVKDLDGLGGKLACFMKDEYKKLDAKVKRHERIMWIGMGIIVGFKIFSFILTKKVI